MTDSKDPLAALISSDAKATDRKQLAELVAPYLVIDEVTKEFGFLSPFADLKNDTKIEVLLAAAKARALYFTLDDGVAPGEVIAMGILAEGSVKTSLKRLFDAHKIKKDKEGRYYLPAHRISELTKTLTS